MQEKWAKLLANYQREIPSSSFRSQLFSKIKEKPVDWKLLKIRVWISAVVALLSVLVSVPLCGRLILEIQQSGLLQFLSLMFVDMKTVMSVWQDFFWSVLESLPVFSLLEVGVFLFLFGVSMGVFSTGLREMFQRQHWFSI